MRRIRYTLVYSACFTAALRDRLDVAHATWAAGAKLLAYAGGRAMGMSARAAPSAPGDA